MVQLVPPLNGEPTNETDTPEVNRANLVGDDEDFDTETDEAMQEASTAKKSTKTTYLEQIFSNKFEAV